jgi:hypothetical protein
MSDLNTIEVNGAVPERTVSRELVEERLTTPLTEGYKPTLPLWALGVGDEPLPQFWLIRDVERMLIHGHIRRCLSISMSGVAGAEFWGGKNPQQPDDPQGLPICAENPEVGDFVFKQVNRFWDQGIPRLQKAAYPYGWGAAENMYRRTPNGAMEWDGLSEFSPIDSFMVILNKRPEGVQIRNIHRVGSEGKGMVNLWFATRDVPAKALWYVHNPRCNQYYGQSQLIGAWRDWRRLATKGAAEMVLDGGFFRLGYRAPLIRYPDEDMQVTSPIQGTQADSRGNQRRPARDIARQIGEQIQAGAAMGMSSKKYRPEEGGDYMWDVKDWGYDFDGSHLIAYVEHLLRRISEGMDVPHEVIEAMEGGGFSGRNIPVEAWFFVQQQIADAFLHLFCTQVLEPLVRWRFGEVNWHVEVKNLLESRRKAQAGGDVKNKPGVSPGGPPGMEQPPGISPTHQGASHHPLGGANPPPGPMGGPMIPTSPDGSMFSMDAQARVKSLADRIRAMGGRAV